MSVIFTGKLGGSGSAGTSGSSGSSGSSGLSGDKYTTTYSGSLTISSGIVNIVLEPDLAYLTSHAIMIMYNYSNKMEG